MSDKLGKSILLILSVIVLLVWVRWSFLPKRIQEECGFRGYRNRFFYVKDEYPSTLINNVKQVMLYRGFFKKVYYLDSTKANEILHVLRDKSCVKSDRVGLFNPNMMLFFKNSSGEVVAEASLGDKGEVRVSKGVLLQTTSAVFNKECIVRLNTILDKY